MIANIWPAGTPSIPGVGLKVQVGNDTCSNRVANIYPAVPTSTLVVGPKDKTFFFLKVVILHIKLKESERRTSFKQNNLSFHTSSTPGWGQKVFLCHLRSMVDT